MNPFVLHGLTVTYIEDFLGEVKHLHNIILVKTTICRTNYGSIFKLKVYRKVQGIWERFSQHLSRVKCETDLHVLQGTLHNYQTLLQYMYDNIHNSHSDTDDDSQ